MPNKRSQMFIGVVTRSKWKWTPEYAKQAKESDAKMEELFCRNPGEVTEIRSGHDKGLMLYKPTLQGVPESLPNYAGEGFDKEEFAEMQRTFKENRVKWFNEGLFNITFEGDVSKLTVYMVILCANLVRFEMSGNDW